MTPSCIKCSASQSIRHDFFSNPEIVHTVLDRTFDDLEKWNASEDDKANVKIVLAEAINNIIEHAYQFEQNQPVVVALTRLEDYLTIVIWDNGRPMPFGQIPAEKHNDLDCAAGELPEGGFGWQIIRSLSESICYSRSAGRNILTLKLKLSDSH